MMRVATGPGKRRSIAWAARHAARHAHHRTGRQAVFEIRTPELTLAMNQPASKAKPALVESSESCGSHGGSEGSYFDRLSARRKVCRRVLGAVVSLAVFATAGAFHGLDGHRPTIRCAPASVPQACAWNASGFTVRVRAGQPRFIGAGADLVLAGETSGPVAAHP